MNLKKTKYFSIADAINDERILEEIEEKKKRYDETGTIELSGIATGYEKLDDKLNGLQAGHLITIAGRAGMGKTFLALNWVLSIDEREKIPVLIFSFEMSKKQLLFRLISLKSGVHAKKIQQGVLTGEEWPRVKAALEELKKLPIYIVDDSANSQLRNFLTIAREIHAERRIGIIFVDHIGLMKTGNDIKNRAYEIGEITRELKLLAMAFHIPIIELAQLNREADKPEPPQLSHLKDSGSVEQDSDVVIFIHRRDYFDPTDRPHQAQIMIKKNRHGEEGEIAFDYCKESWRLTEQKTIGTLMPRAGIKEVNWDEK